MLIWDHVIFSLQRQGGITRWWIHHCNALRRVLELPIVDLGPFVSDNPNTELLVRGDRHVDQGAPGKLWFLWKLPIPGQATLFHGSYFRVPPPGPKVLLSYFDASSIKGRSIRSRMHHWLQRKCLQRADLIHCISRHAATEMRTAFPWIPPDRIRVVPLGIELADDEEAVEGVLHDSPFVIFVGQRGGYKNGALALEAIARLPGIRLIFVGGGKFSPEEVADIACLGVAGAITHLGTIPDAKLCWLYNRALALWYPSSNEGFGFPAIEAAARGCPVVAASGHAVEEVAGEYAQLSAKPTAEWMAQVTIALRGADRAALRSRGRVVAARYTWHRYAEAMAAVYAELGAAVKAPEGADARNKAPNNA